MGNILMGDDGVGVHVINTMKNSAPDHTLFVEIGTAPLRALHLLEEYHKIIIIDAMKAGNKPGTIYEISEEDIQKDHRCFSMHEMNLFHALDFIDQTKRPEIRIIGVEPEIIDLDMNLSSSLEKKLPEIRNRVMINIKNFHGGNA